MESLGYTMIELLTGTLPWEDPQYQHLGMAGLAHLKQAMPLAQLCQGLLQEFEQYFQTVRGLRFDEAPPYARFRRMFQSLARRLQFRQPNPYDWIKRLYVEEYHANLMAYLPIDEVQVGRSQRRLLRRRDDPMLTDYPTI